MDSETEEQVSMELDPRETDYAIIESAFRWQWEERSRERSRERKRLQKIRSGSSLSAFNEVFGDPSQLF